MRRKFNYIFIFTFAFVFLFVIGNAQIKSVYAKSFVKKDRILLRWIPADKKIFDVAVKSGYKITRYVKEGNNLTSPFILSAAVLPYSKLDTMKWALFLKDCPGGVMAYRTICAPDKNKALSVAEKANEKMFYDMFLLSCDFDSRVAKASGLFFSDTTISEGKIYSYKIEINNLPPALKYAPMTIEVNSSKLSQNPQINNLRGKFKARLASLKWNAAEFRSDYGSYNIERSADSSNFSKVNYSPVILMASQFEKNKEFIFYDDTLPKTSIKYFYRIRGVNHFGEESEPSNVISGIGYDQLNSYPFIDSIKTIQNQKVLIRFRMKDRNENRKPKEFIIVRSKEDEGPYAKIFSSKEPATYIDEKPESTNYYKAGAVCYDGDTLFSYSYLALITDTVPPAVPDGLKAVVDAKGNVTLTWNRNAEKDFQGYKVLKSNALHEEFVQINNEFVVEPIYKDKLNLKTLSKTIYYSVVATDKRYNNSKKCTPVEVKRPDTIPPVKPIITNLEMKNKGINVNWINSNSEDVKYYVLYRTTELQIKETKLREWQAKDSLKQFLDTTVEAGLGYKYHLLVSDEDDNISISNNPYIKFETGYRKKITDIKFTVDRTLKTVKLNWNYDANGIEKFILYRCKKGGQLTIVKTFPSKIHEFTDTNLNIGNIYEYRIKPVFSNGAEGIISDAVIVEY